MKNKNKVIVYILIVIAALCFVMYFSYDLLFKNSNEQQAFTLKYAKKNNNTYFTMEGYTDIKTIILPVGSNFFDTDDILQGYFKFYDYDTGEEVTDITYNATFDKNVVGEHTLVVTGKYNNKIGTTTFNVKYEDACSGVCTINNSNWKIELLGNNFVKDYGLYVQVKLYPTEKAHYNPYLLNLANYEDVNDGYIQLYYEPKVHTMYELAYDPSSEELDNALTLYYKLNSNKIKQATYIKFRVTYYSHYINDETYIDFYDKPTSTHHFYYVNRGGKK